MVEGKFAQLSQVSKYYEYDHVEELTFATLMNNEARGRELSTGQTWWQELGQEFLDRGISL